MKESDGFYRFQDAFSIWDRFGDKKKDSFQNIHIKKIIFSYKFCSSDSQKRGGGGRRVGEGSVQCCHNTRKNAG